MRTIERETEEKVNHRWKRRFSRNGSGSLVPMGKIVPLLLRLLHTLIYFKREGEGRDPSFPSAADESLSRISSMGIDARDTVEGLFYLSLNGNRIPTCYFLWEDFFGRWILSHSWEAGRLCVERSSSSGRVACEGECCVSCYKRKSIHFSIVTPWYENNTRLPPRSSLEF